MSGFQLIVPHELANQPFENCTIVAHSNCWPIMSDILQTTESAAPFIAATCSTNADSVRQMLKMLENMRHPDRRIVLADDPIPSDLRAAFPKPLYGFLQRVLPCDLMCISASVAQQTTAETMLLTVFGGEAETESVAASPCLERFPHVGPGNDAAVCVTSSAALSSSIDSALSGVKLSSPDRKCVKAGLLMLWDFLDESHEISQTMEGRGTPRTGDYWHGIMHRREPDAGNASYWFRRVGVHPAFVSLATDLDRWMAETGASEDERSLATEKLITNGSFDPFAAIELSTKVLRDPGELEDRILRRVQYLEILNLLSWSFSIS